MTITRLDVDASIWLAAGTASAGSLLVSNARHLSLWPSTPPAALTTWTPVRQPAEPVVPLSALAPVYAYSVATVSVAPPVSPEDEPEQAANPTATVAANHPAAGLPARACLLRLTCSEPPFSPLSMS